VLLALLPGCSSDEAEEEEEARVSSLLAPFFLSFFLAALGGCRGRRLGHKVGRDAVPQRVRQDHSHLVPALGHHVCQHGGGIKAWAAASPPPSPSLSAEHHESVTRTSELVQRRSRLVVSAGTGGDAASSAASIATECPNAPATALSRSTVSQRAVPGSSIHGEQGEVERRLQAPERQPGDT
jgi:hypothetical protein